MSRSATAPLRRNPQATSNPKSDTGKSPRKDAPVELAAVVGQNLRRLRMRRGLSLERLAKLSGVSRAMLGQIETARSVPTINLLWKIASALDVQFSALIATAEPDNKTVLRKDKSKVLESGGGKFTSRALFPFDRERRVEFYELEIAPGHLEEAEPHAPGTLENIVVTRGRLEITCDHSEPSELGEGDAILFKADVPHSYRNPGTSPTTFFLVVSYAQNMN